VTKANCTPASQNERCGKAFIFNQEFLVWYVSKRTRKVRLEVAAGATFLLDEVGIPEKFARPYPSAELEGYAVRIEDLSKTELGMGRLSLRELGPAGSAIVV
jgi:hypothetical protein